jgi:hypothetical protein
MTNGEHVIMYESTLVITSAIKCTKAKKFQTERVKRRSVAHGSGQVNRTASSRSCNLSRHEQDSDQIHVPLNATRLSNVKIISPFLVLHQYVGPETIHEYTCTSICTIHKLFLGELKLYLIFEYHSNQSEVGSLKSIITAHHQAL